ncbi:unnamed protein product [Prunus armeniaca]|uniref:Uncharacterized protein n=1 Tax=Prunus armeniaca TaxID=36596 RepID=A0A6J5UUI0_PRUAR|nr:unnamed protein product [Prunus armeniaca]CAB4310644.1 unnamed protein product [Prunus armeniaca]
MVVELSMWGLFMGGDDGSIGSLAAGYGFDGGGLTEMAKRDGSGFCGWLWWRREMGLCVACGWWS